LLPQEAYGGKTQLHHAVIERLANVVKTLLVDGAGVDIKDDSGNGPIHYAVLADDSQIVEILLRFGADVGGKGKMSRTPLHLAITNLDILHTLLQHGAAHVSSQDQRGDTPLHLAIPLISNEVGVAIVCKLLESGADVNIPNNMGMSAFHKLLDQTYYDLHYEIIVKFLSAGASLTKPMPDGRLPLQVFLARSNASALWYQKNDGQVSPCDVIRCLLDKGADPGTVCSNQEPFIFHFFIEGRALFTPDGLLAELLCHKSSPNLVSKRGNYIIHDLARVTQTKWSNGKNVPDFMEIILGKGVNPNQLNSQRQTPLMALFRNKTIERDEVDRRTVILLNAGADPRIRDTTGNLLLFEALRHRDRSKIPWGSVQEMVKLLFREMKNGYSVDNCKNEDERRWWENWENMARANTWTASNTIFDSPKVLISGEIDEDFKKMACFVVAESHLEAAMKKSPTEIEVGYKQHHLEYVAGILRDMRDLRLPIRDCYYNYLVDILCR
jgi:ankyrin repeat protein